VSWTHSHLTEAQAKAAIAAAPRGQWLLAGTPQDQPYPCRCHEAKFGRCHPAFCPCGGRLDPQGPTCCAVVNTPARVAQAAAEYRIKKDRERAGEA
jgi:hypothetical protein